MREEGLPAPRVFLVDRAGDGWAPAIDLTERDGLMGSYFHLLADGTLYFHREGDLYRATIEDDAVRYVMKLGAPINTDDGVEFGAWVHPDEARLLVFTRSVEGDPERSGVFSTRREQTLVVGEMCGDLGPIRTLDHPALGDNSVDQVGRGHVEHRVPGAGAGGGRRLSGNL